MNDETRFFLNGEEVPEEELISTITKWQEEMNEYEEALAKELDISIKTASMIAYLRTRSRWTQEKEDWLIAMDHSSDVPSDMMGRILRGEF